MALFPTKALLNLFGKQMHVKFVNTAVYGLLKYVICHGRIDSRSF